MFSAFGTPVVACEIEFYLHGAAEAVLSAFWRDVASACATAGIGIVKMEAERGAGQHEVALAPTGAQKAAGDCAALKLIISEAAQARGLAADFSAKPFTDQPGSGLHVHVHLEDAQGRNVFFKDDTSISDPLKHCIGGLLAHMQADMHIFAPTEASHARFVAGSNAPLTVSWGANNRTTALRLPDTGYHKRIEHRVAGADADPAQVVEAILKAMLDGLTNKTEPPAQVYGDASLPQYGLPLLL